MGRPWPLLGFLAAIGLSGIIGAAGVLVDLHEEAQRAWAELDEVADPDGAVVAVDVAPDGTLWRLTQGRGCFGCEVLWRRTDDETWEARGGIPSGDLRVSQLRVADDGQVLAAGESLWASDDGGLSWSEQVDGERGMQVGVMVQGGYALAHLGTDELGGWAVRAPIGTDDWEPVDLPLETWPNSGSLLAVGDVLIVQSPAAGTASDDDIAFVSRDQGDTWQPLALPCWTTWIQAGPHRAFAFCNIGTARELEQGMRVFRTDPDSLQWQLFVTIPPRGIASGLSFADALSDDLVLGAVISGRRNGAGLLAEGRVLRTTLPPVVADDAVAPDGTTYVVAKGRLLSSKDQGRTWKPLP